MGKEIVLPIEPPNDYKEITDSVCSNFSHEIDQAVAERLKNENAYSAYPAWEWYGLVWVDKPSGKFCCYVRRHHRYIGTTYADSMEELAQITSDKYGWE